MSSNFRREYSNSFNETGTGSGKIGAVGSSTAPAVGYFDIANYAGTDFRKIALGTHINTSRVGTNGERYMTKSTNGNDAINTLKFTVGGGDAWGAGSIVSVYGLL